MFKISPSKSAKVILGLLGFFSLIWFLIRVIPKPSRAGYPCQRTAFPLASGFVLWVVGLLGGNYFFMKTKLYFQKSNLVLVFLFLTFSATFYSLLLVSFNTDGFSNPAETTEVFIPTDNPNSPVGVAKGIFPGRVVWNYNPNATHFQPDASQNPVDANSGATEPVIEGKWYKEGNIVQAEVEKMISETICKLTETTNDADAWNSLFQYFNKNHGKGEAGYRSGEKIAIKINLNNSGNHGEMSGYSNISPQMVLGLLRQLVNNAHIPASMITFYDVSRQIPSSIFDLCKTEFPTVNFVDQVGGDGRLKGVKNLDAKINWSKPLVLEPLASPGNPAYLPTCVTEATYLINFSNLKAHSLAGISICAKNMFGSFISPNSSGLQPPQSAGIHPYIAVRTSDGYTMRSMKSYSSMVDMLGNKDLGGKTLLFLVDALYAVPSQGAEITEGCKWNSAPFKGNWTSSLFASLDVIALESVCIDFLRTEQSVSATMKNVSGNVDNYLHEAAQANLPPSGTIYNPNIEARLSSLGVHEHWNNAADKKYSRNLGTGEGIELVSIQYDWISTKVRNQLTNNSMNDLNIYPNPSNGLINIELKESKSAQVSVYDLTGKMVYSGKMEKNKEQIDLTGFRGMLLVKVEGNQISVTKPVVINKL